MILMAFLLMLGIHARNIFWGMTSAPGWMPRLKLRIKVTARSKAKQVYFLIRIAIRVFKIAIHAIQIILLMFNMLKIKSRNVENNSLCNVIAIMG